MFVFVWPEVIEIIRWRWRQKARLWGQRMNSGVNGIVVYQIQQLKWVGSSRVLWIKDFFSQKIRIQHIACARNYVWIDLSDNCILVGETIADWLLIHHHIIIFLKRRFDPRYARARRLPHIWSPHISLNIAHSGCNQAISCHLSHTLPSLPVLSARISCPRHHHISTGRHPIIYTFHHHHHHHHLFLKTSIFPR